MPHPLLPPRVSEDGFVANLPAIVQDYKATRNLKPLRVVLQGPPESGTTEWGQRLAAHYHIHYVDVDSALAEVLALPDAPAPGEEGGDGGGEEEEENKETSPASGQALRLEVEKFAGGEGAVDASAVPRPLLCRVLRRVLASRRCQNQGWVLDAYPETWESAARLFGAEPEGGAPADDSEDPYPDPEELDKAFEPSAVVILEADDESLSAKVLAYTEEQVVQGRTDEASFKKRLAEFREHCGETNERSPVAFFESLCKMETLQIPAGADEGKERSAEELLETATTYCERKGKPFNYHPTEEETEAKRLAELEAKNAVEAAAAEEKKRDEDAEKDARRKREDAEQKRVHDIQENEKELLAARSLPLRKYLMSNVIPSLTEGLVETCRVDPEDPIDFLAEWLFKHSAPEPGKEGKHHGHRHT